MQTKSHTTFAAALAGAVLALAVASPAAFSRPATEPAFPSAVPAQPGQMTGAAAAAQTAREQERYYGSYGVPKPLISQPTSVDDGGVDWPAIGIAVGATFILAGALIALVTRTRRRTHRVRVAA